MRYLPAACVALGVCGAVAYAVNLTKNPNCLWALFFLGALELVWPKELRKK